LIDGKTLREHLSHRESLQLNVILKIGVQVSEALAAAHQAGIVHRDVKPENIMLRKDGYAKVLDFGLAKLTEKQTTDEVSPEEATRVFVKTTPGMVMGTVSYMSPEQARGNETDARTDIWGLGVVLYEMLAGKVPFTGETVNHTIVSILEKEPLLLEDVPAELQRIVRKSLTKDVEMRYQTAHDLLIDLKNLRRDLDFQGELERSIIPNRDTANASLENATQVNSDPAATTRSGQIAATQNITTSSSSLEYAVTQAKSHRLATAIIGVLLIGVISIAGYFAFVSRGGSAEQISSIAVLPFENKSGNADSDYLSDGVAESLIYKLSQLPKLKVSPRSSAFRYKGKEIDTEKIGAELGVDAVLSGRIVQRGDSLTISVDLVDVRSKKTLWGEQYERKLSDLLATQREIAETITEKLQIRLSGNEAKAAAKQYTNSNEAYQAYLKGRFFWNKRSGENLQKAIDLFKSAYEIDPNFALAYVGLADSYGVAGYYDSSLGGAETLIKAKSYAIRALEIDDSLSEAHASLANINTGLWNWDEAEEGYKRSIELNPNYASAHQWYGNQLMDFLRLEEALAEMKRAQELEPLSLIVSLNLADLYQMKGELPTSLEQFKRTIDLDPNWFLARQQLALLYLKMGRNADAESEAVKSMELSNRATLPLSVLGLTYARIGKRAEAESILSELKARYEKRNANGHDIARVYVGLGDTDQAFAWLEKDYQARISTLPTWFVISPFDSLRDDPRYKDLARRMGTMR
jgi:eukaryotic-like serine/threonine-protein kinase